MLNFKRAMATKIYGYYMRGAADEMICMILFSVFMIWVPYFKLPVNGHKLYRDGFNRKKDCVPISWYPKQLHK